jgi:hypothetical protein
MSVLSVISDLIEAILSTPGTIPVPDAAEAEPLPDGWPPHYDRHLLEGGPYAGRYVVTVKCAVTGRVARTLLPAWFTEEAAREDAWQRHADDPAPELADE